jgi:hypothetical protein
MSLENSMTMTSLLGKSSGLLKFISR